MRTKLFSNLIFISSVYYFLHLKNKLLLLRAGFSSIKYFHWFTHTVSLYFMIKTLLKLENVEVYSSNNVKVILTYLSFYFIENFKELDGQVLSVIPYK